MSLSRFQRLNYWAIVFQHKTYIGFLLDLCWCVATLVIVYPCYPCSLWSVPYHEASFSEFQVFSQPTTERIITLSCHGIIFTYLLKYIVLDTGCIIQPYSPCGGKWAGLLHKYAGQWKPIQLWCREKSSKKLESSEKNIDTYRLINLNTIHAQTLNEVVDYWLLTEIYDTTKTWIWQCYFLYKNKKQHPVRYHLVWNLVGSHPTFCTLKAKEKLIIYESVNWWP